MQKKARTYFFYKNDEAVLSRELSKSTMHFAELNPSWEVVFGGNDPSKSLDASQDAAPDLRLNNIVFEDTPKAVDPKEYSLVASFADASLETSPHNTKDLWSYLASRQDGKDGILNFDGDHEWSVPISDSFRITGSIIPHRLQYGSCENSAFAYKSHQGDVMGELLGRIGSNLHKFFDISSENIDGTMRRVFTSKNTQWIDTIVNEVHFKPYGDIVEKYSDGKTKLNDVLQYKAPISSYYMKMDLGDGLFPKRVVSLHTHAPNEESSQSLQA